jgi:hypothetical protein
MPTNRFPNGSSVSVYVYVVNLLSEARITDMKYQINVMSYYESCGLPLQIQRSGFYSRRYLIF